MIVADTNLIAYFFIAGENSAAAKDVLRKDQEWAAPPLWRSEFRNVLWTYIRNRHLQISDALLLLREAEELVGRREFEVASDNVLVLAAQSGCSPYDCEFVYVAQKHGVPLVTFDKKLLANFPSVAISASAFLQ